MALKQISTEIGDYIDKVVVAHYPTEGVIHKTEREKAAYARDLIAFKQALVGVAQFTLQTAAKAILPE